MAAPAVTASELFGTMAAVLYEKASMKLPEQEPEQPESEEEEEEEVDLPPPVKADPNVFYKDANYFYKAPIRPCKLKCTARVECTGNNPAEIKCYSCIKFDPTRKGYFCEECYRARHPWYRVAHKACPIDEAEDIEQDFQHHLYVTEVARVVEELQVMLKDVAQWTESLVAQDSVEGNDLMKQAAKAITGVECNMLDLKDMMKEERGKVSQATIDDALMEARMLQRAYEKNGVKGLAGGKIRAKPFRPSVAFATPEFKETCALSIQVTYKKLVDKSSQRVYFQDTKAKTTQWTRPPFITKNRMGILLSPRSYKIARKRGFGSVY